MPFGGGIPFFGMPGMGGSRGPGGSDGDDGSGEPPHFEFSGSLGDRMASWSKRTLITAIIVAILVLLAAYWWFHPPISINSVDTWIFVAIFILLPCFLFFRGRSRRYETGDSKLDPNPGKAKTFKYLKFLPVAILLVGVIGWVVSLDLFPGNAEKYANVLKTDTMTFAEDIQEVEDYHILVLCLSDDVGHPFVGLAAYIDEDVAVGYIYDIGRRGLVAVQIGAVVEQHIELDIHVVLYDLAYPVIDGEDGGDDLDVGI
jgi:hypothetical protein